MPANTHSLAACRPPVAPPLDTGAQGDPGAAARERFEARTAQNLWLAYVMTNLEGTLAGVPLGEYEARVPGVGDVGEMLVQWWWRLSWCGHRVQVRRCPSGHDTRVVFECCKTPVCAHDRAVRSRAWARRMRLLERRLPSGRQWWEVAARLRARGQLAGPVPGGPNPRARMAWRVITIGLRDTGDVIGDLQRTAGPLRTNFNRWLKRHGAVASFLAVDIGADHGHPHLHVVTYSPYLKKAEVQRWLRSQDCEVSGCSHDDASCPGSWEVGIEAAPTPAAILAYASLWPLVPPGDVLAAERHAAAALVLYRRPRVEATGLAAPGAWRDQLRTRHESLVCRVCGAPLEECGEGERQDDETYAWSVTGSRYGSTWSQRSPPLR